MVKFTKNDILLYISNELSTAKQHAFEAALLTDWALQEQYNVVLETLSDINSPLVSPSSSTVSNILAYANATQITKV